MPRPGAGELRHFITIERQTQSRDSSGGMLKAWTMFATARAKIVNKSGLERDVTGHGGATGIERTEFTIRYLAGIDTTMRVIYNGKYYAINYVNDYNEEHRFLILITETGLSDG